jgi:hypothetical protein
MVLFFQLPKTCVEVVNNGVAYPKKSLGMAPIQLGFPEMCNHSIGVAGILITLSKAKLDHLEVTQNHPNAKADKEDSTLGICHHGIIAVWHRFEPLQEMVKPISVGMKFGR